MIARALSGLTLLFLLVACAPEGNDPLAGLAGEQPDQLAPESHLTEGADGLVAGHRLMKAEQYELALKAFRRAALKQGLTAEILASMGTANLGLGRLNQSEHLLRQAVAKDPAFVPGWNNLGVVLMERGETVEAQQVFHRAYALDNGESDQIRNNLRLSIAKLDEPQYDGGNDNEFELVRRGNGSYLLLPTHGQRAE